MKLEIIGIFLWLFGTICLILANPRDRNNYNITRQSLFWAGIILNIVGLIVLIPFVISWF